MMTNEKFKEYLEKAQILFKTNLQNTLFSAEIESLIKTYAEENKDPFYSSLLQGESAFYKKNYGLALKFYLIKPETPLSSFLCFRASACVHLESGDKVKALDYAKKALTFFPEDVHSLKICKSILEEKTENSDKPEWELKAKAGGKEWLMQIQAIHEQLLDGLNYTRIDELQEDKMALKLYLLEEIEKKIIAKQPQILANKAQELAIAVYDEVMGFGPIEPLFRDETITDIFVNGPDSVFVERRGKVEKVSICFLDNDHIYRLVQRVASKSGRHLDLGSPYFDAQLLDGSRIHAIIPPLAIDGIKVSLRKYSFQKLQIERLVQGGSLTEVMSQFLQVAVKARFNIAICGGTGSGKTTLMNSLLASIGKGERIITIEDTIELEPCHHHFVRLLTRVPNQEGKGGVTQADLMINALRMRPDRVILGELRGSEAFNLLHAMNTGQDGTMVTLHASGSEEVVSRLLNMILMARYALSAESVRQQIASALDLIVYVSRLVDGSRRVMNISQVSNGENGELIINDIFRFDIEKISSSELKGKFLQFNVEPTKKHLSKLITTGQLNNYRELLSNDSLTKI